jgi:mitogen-activated protein kinase 1/3
MKGTATSAAYPKLDGWDVGRDY